MSEIINVPSIAWDDEIILEEIETFRRLNPDPLVVCINDDSMEPFLHKGDYVAGNRKYGDDIQKHLGLICIIETIDCLQLCRRLDKGKKTKILHIIMFKSINSG